MKTTPIRHLVLVLGDQLSRDAAVFDGFDKQRDAIWMAEVEEESTHVWSHKARIALFLSAMRHFAEELRGNGMRVSYTKLDDRQTARTLVDALQAAVNGNRPQRLIMTEPGEWRVLKSLQDAAKSLRLPLDVLPDRHFLCSRDEFGEHARGRKQLRMEFFYREMRRKHDCLMENGKPLGGAWNYDADNRSAFGKEGPPDPPAPLHFPRDATTREVIAIVERTFGRHPGELKHFNWPVTRKQAVQSLDDFITHRLPTFGQYQDAMWAGEPFLFHSLLASSLNLKLLSPAEVIVAAEEAHRANPKRYPLNAVEGFIRQILGWREYVRGVYWLYMPEYKERNALAAAAPLPSWYWTGDIDMTCMRDALQQTLEYGYAHHIQRLMVTGLFALTLGVDPVQVHQWYLAVYVDAVEWVELPNTMGMSQYADDGVMASKPYAATGKYIQRMSNYCKECRFKPAQATGEEACPFTTLYWDFLLTHEKRLAANPRMKLQVRNIDRLTAERRKAIRARALWIRQELAV